MGSWLNQYRGLMTTILAALGALVTLAAVVAGGIDYYFARFVEVPALRARGDELIRRLTELESSIQETETLRRVLALIPGHIRRIDRGIYISYDKTVETKITLTIDDKSYQWKVRIEEEEDGRYSGLFSINPAWSMGSQIADDPQYQKFFDAMRNTQVFLRAAKRIDLDSSEPQIIFSDTSGDPHYKFYIIIEDSEGENRRWRCAVIATEETRLSPEKG